MFGYRDVVTALRDLDLGEGTGVVVHASLSAFDRVEGGAQAVVGALISTCGRVLIPAFTYQTLIIPEVGPEDNAMTYGSAAEQNRAAEFFHPDLPVHPSVGEVAETLRKHPLARRSHHPILSFCGVNAEEALAQQTLEEPLAPVGWLASVGGHVLLLGVDQTANVALHYVERLVGRRQFVRWALTPEGVVTCPHMPGCSRGFPAINPRLEGVSRITKLGTGWIEAVPLRDLVQITSAWLREEPQALLCDNADCLHCRAGQ